MRKFLLSLGLAALLSWPLTYADAAAVPQATVVENTVAGGMDAAGELSGTLTVQPFTTVSIFWGGTYSAANRFELQREVGSPGSGAFETVMRLDTATANADDSATWISGPNTEAFRVAMTTAGTGDVLVTMTDASRTPNDFSDFRIYMEYFTEFDTQTTAVDAAHFLAQSEAAGTAYVVVVGIEEGGVTGTTDTGSDGVDAQTLCTITTTDKAGLVSDGWMAFEYRTRQDNVGANSEMGGGFVDAVCDGDSGDIPATASSQELTVVGYTNVAVILQDGDGTDTTSFTPFSVNAGVEQHDIDTVNTAHFYDTAIDMTANTYDILRIEIDASGDVFSYINGTLVYAEATGVATTATLVPQAWINSADGGATTNAQTIDYWLFYITKPSDAT